ncbi:MAG TPA: hypothetical protein VG498_08610 [Terriglobales bacterium]|nr:hypothetical protein [Terriglobales bacterium]
MRQLLDVADFMRRVRWEMRFGELSRAPLSLLRLEVRSDHAECEWIARDPDPWDMELAPRITQRRQTLQALRDAIGVRELLFSMLPQVSTASFRVYRRSQVDACDLVVTGSVAREDEVSMRIASVAMRANLYGLRFSLDNGVLQPLQEKDSGLQLVTN